MQTSDPSTDNRTSSSVATTVQQAREWVTTSRIRVFGTGAATAFVLMLLSLLVPSPLTQVIFAGGFAVLAIVFGLLGAATWFAERNGTTDSSDLWDSAPVDNAEVEDLFTGFTSFTEDGSPAPDPHGRRDNSVGQQGQPPVQ